MLLGQSRGRYMPTHLVRVLEVDHSLVTCKPVLGLLVFQGEATQLIGQPTIVKLKLPCQWAHYL